jgi:hypothetical protein
MEDGNMELLVIIGEEQELVFAKLSRYGSVTKHMSPACN